MLLKSWWLHVVDDSDAHHLSSSSQESHTLNCPTHLWLLAARFWLHYWIWAQDSTFEHWYYLIMLLDITIRWKRADFHLKFLGIIVFIKNVIHLQPNSVHYWLVAYPSIHSLETPIITKLLSSVEIRVSWRLFNVWVKPGVLKLLKYNVLADHFEAVPEQPIGGLAWGLCKPIRELSLLNWWCFHLVSHESFGNFEFKGSTSFKFSSKFCRTS